MQMNAKLTNRMVEGSVYPSLPQQLSQAKEKQEDKK